LAILKALVHFSVLFFFFSWHHLLFSFFLCFSVAMWEIFSNGEGFFFFFLI
jgi:hypothetical protein